MFAGAVGQDVLSEGMLVGRHVAQRKDLGDLMLCWRHFLMHDGGRHAKLPHLGVKMHEDGLHFWCQRAEVIQTFILPFQRRSSNDSPPAHDENGPLRVGLPVAEEGTLIWVITHHLVTLQVAQRPDQTAAFAVDGIHRTKMKRFLVESLSLVGHE